MKNELIPDDAKMENAPADSGIRLKDLLLLTLQEADVYCVHETADVVLSQRLNLPVLRKQAAKNMRNCSMQK